jgi:hypothetical protein
VPGHRRAVPGRWGRGMDLEIAAWAWENRIVEAA